MKLRTCPYVTKTGTAVFTKKYYDKKTKLYNSSHVYECTMCVTTCKGVFLPVLVPVAERKSHSWLPSCSHSCWPGCECRPDESRRPPFHCKAPEHATSRYCYRV